MLLDTRITEKAKALIEVAMVRSRMLFVLGLITAIINGRELLLL